MEFPFASRFTANHDLVLVGYRGVDGSSRLDCPEVDSTRAGRRATCSRERAARLGRALQRLRRPAHARTATTSPATRSPQRVDDFEDARRALGYDRIDLLSESSGTRAALIYA